MIPATSPLERKPITERFEALVERWRAETALLSSTTAMTNHPAYRSIIALGSDAIPLLLRELEREGAHWFEALEAITGENPVPREHWGNIPSMRGDWLAWGRDRRLI
jgi:hypothetical protein